MVLIEAPVVFMPLPKKFPHHCSSVNILWPHTLSDPVCVCFLHQENITGSQVRSEYRIQSKEH